MRAAALVGAGDAGDRHAVRGATPAGSRAIPPAQEASQSALVYGTYVWQKEPVERSSLFINYKRFLIKKKLKVPSHTTPKNYKNLLTMKNV